MEFTEAEVNRDVHNRVGNTENVYFAASAGAEDWHFLDPIYFHIRTHTYIRQNVLCTWNLFCSEFFGLAKKFLEQSKNKLDSYYLRDNYRLNELEIKIFNIYTNKYSLTNDICESDSKVIACVIEIQTGQTYKKEIQK